MNIYDEKQQLQDMIDTCEDLLKRYPFDHVEYNKIKIQIEQLKSKLKKEGK